MASEIKVKEIMVPLKEYATVGLDKSLYEAIVALEDVRTRYDHRRYKHRAILVYDDNNKIVGKITPIDILRALEPKYNRLGDLKHLGHSGFTRDFIRKVMTDNLLWEKPLEDICHKATRIKVRDFMSLPSETEFIEAEATLNEGIHQLIMGRYLSILVTENDEVVGILRLSDVFSEVSGIIKDCGLDQSL